MCTSVEETKAKETMRETLQCRVQLWSDPLQRSGPDALVQKCDEFSNVVHPTM